MSLGTSYLTAPSFIFLIRKSEIITGVLTSLAISSELLCKKADGKASRSCENEYKQSVLVPETENSTAVAVYSLGPSGYVNKGQLERQGRAVTFEDGMGLDKGVAALDVTGETQALWGTGRQLLAAGCFLLGYHVMTDSH